MNKNRAKEFLLQIKKLDCMIENKLIEAAQWRAIATGTTGKIGGERVQSSPNLHKMEDAIARCVDIENEVEDCIRRMIKAKSEIVSVIERLNPAEYDLLHKIYVQHLTLQEAADKYGNSYSWATTMHGRALKSVEKILESRKEVEKNEL